MWQFIIICIWKHFFGACYQQQQCINICHRVTNQSYCFHVLTRGLDSPTCCSCMSLATFVRDVESSLHWILESLKSSGKRVCQFQSWEIIDWSLDLWIWSWISIRWSCYYRTDATWRLPFYPFDHGCKSRSKLHEITRCFVKLLSSYQLKLTTLKVIQTT